MMKAKGIFMTCDCLNGNGHIYSSSQMKEIVQKYQESIKNGEKLLGELGQSTFYSNINLNNVSHTIEDIKYNEDTHNVEGTINLVDTPQGKIAQTLLKQFGELEIAPRVLNYSNDNNNITSFEVVSFDIVQNSAFPEAKVREEK